MIEPKLPKPAYVNRREFGCPACRNAISWENAGNRDAPEIFQQLETHFGRKLPEWTASFYACRKCRAIWALTFNPKDMIYNDTPTPSGMAQAVLPEATLDDLMMPLFAWAPIDEITERALWELQYEPQELWNRLIAAWRHPEIDMARKADILRQLARLLTTNNPYHRELKQQRGWLLQNLHGFEEDLEVLHRQLAEKAHLWGAAKQYATENLDNCRRLLKAPGTLRGRQAEPTTVKKKRAAADVRPQKVRLAAGALLRGEAGAAAKAASAPAASESKRIRKLLLPYWRYLPAIVFGWLLVEWIGGNVPEANRWIAQSFFFCFVLVLTGVGVAVNAGISGAGFGRIAWHRLSVVGDYLLFALMVVILLLVYGLIAAVFDPGLQHPWHWLAVPGCAALLMIRFWPFWVIPYMQPVELDMTSTRSPGVPKRSSLTTAWKLTREPGVFRSCTLPWLLITGLAVTVLSVAGWLFGPLARMLLLYPVLLPFLTALTWAFVEPMPSSAFGIRNAECTNRRSG